LPMASQHPYFCPNCCSRFATSLPYCPQCAFARQTALKWMCPACQISVVVKYVDKHCQTQKHQQLAAVAARRAALAPALTIRRQDSGPAGVKTARVSVFDKRAIVKHRKEEVKSLKERPISRQDIVRWALTADQIRLVSSMRLKDAARSLRVHEHVLVQAAQRYGMCLLASDCTQSFDLTW